MNFTSYLVGLITVLCLSGAATSAPGGSRNASRTLDLSPSLISDVLPASLQQQWRIQRTSACTGPLLVEIWEAEGRTASYEASVKSADSHFCAELMTSEVTSQNHSARVKEACRLQLPYLRLIEPDPGQDTWFVSVWNNRQAIVEYHIRASCTSPLPCPQPVLGSQKICSEHGLCGISNATIDTAVCNCKAGWRGAGCQVAFLHLNKQIDVEPLDAAGITLPGAAPGTWSLYLVEVPAATLDADDGEYSLVVEMPVLWSPVSSSNSSTVPGLCTGLRSQVFSPQGEFQPSKMSCFYGKGGKYNPAAKATFPRDLMQGFSWVIQDPCASCRGTEASQNCSATCSRPQAVYLLVRDTGSHPARLRARMSRSGPDSLPGIAEAEENLCPYKCFGVGECSSAAEYEEWNSCDKCRGRSIPDFLDAPGESYFCEGERFDYDKQDMQQYPDYTLPQPSYMSAEYLTLRPADAYWWQLNPADVDADVLLLHLADYKRDGIRWVHDDDLHITAYSEMPSYEEASSASSIASGMCWNTTALQLPAESAGKAVDMYRKELPAKCGKGKPVLLLLQNFGNKSISFNLVASPSKGNKSNGNQAGVIAGSIVAVVVVFIVGTIIVLMHLHGGCSWGVLRAQQPSQAATAALSDVEMANGQTAAATRSGAVSTAAAWRKAGLPLAVVQSFPVHAYSQLVAKQAVTAGTPIPDVQPQADAVGALDLNAQVHANSTPAGAGLEGHSHDNIAADVQSLGASTQTTTAPGVPTTLSNHTQVVAAEGTPVLVSETHASAISGVEPVTAVAIVPGPGLQSQSWRARAAKLRRNPTTNPLCAICLDEYVEGDLLRTLPCIHAFHKGCIDSWMTSHINCPVCRLGFQAT